MLRVWGVNSSVGLRGIWGMGVSWWDLAVLGSSTVCSVSCKLSNFFWWLDVYYFTGNFSQDPRGIRLSYGQPCSP